MRLYRTTSNAAQQSAKALLIDGRLEPIVMHHSGRRSCAHFVSTALLTWNNSVGRFFFGKTNEKALPHITF